jgi:hypothetical protein
VAGRTSLVLAALVALSTGVFLARRYEGNRVDPCGDHHVVNRPGRTAPARFLTDELREDRKHRSLVELYGAEPRNVGWAPGMEAQLRSAMAPTLARLPGATLSRVCCHSTACRIVIDVTPELKARLNADAREALARTGRVVRGEPAFGLATPALEAMGFAAPSRRPNSARPWWNSFACRFGYCDLGGPAERRNLATLLHEDSIVMFDPMTYSPSDYACWLERRNLARLSKHQVDSAD